MSIDNDARACPRSLKLGLGGVVFSGIRQHRGCRCFWLRSPGVNCPLSEPQALHLQKELSPSPALSLQFHHAPLYLEWAPVGVFSSSAPQTKEPKDPPAGPAGEDRAEPETCKS